MDYIAIEHRGIKADIHLFDVGNGRIGASMFLDRDGILPKGRHTVFPGSSPTVDQAKQLVVPRVRQLIDNALDN